ncbi:MAG: diguanylate cyclase [Candidatus Methylomirabilis oxyfera]|nr:diguanylate cyclase [Candidatus Methylomirabilis oxyfera]
MQEGRQGDNATILIVDDDPGSVSRFQVLLERKGLSIVVARSKQEAMEALVTCQSNLMVLDLEKAHLEGRQILTALRADEGKRHLPVIVFTTGVTAQQRAQGLRWGADDFLVKPIDPEELAARVEVWLRISRLRREALAKNRALAVLYAIATSLSRSLNLKEVLEQALQQVLELMELDAGFVRLQDQGGHELRISAGKGVFAAELEAIGSVGPCEEFARAIVLAEAPILISNVAEAPRALAAVGAIPSVRSAAGMPLVSKHRVVGTISMFGRHPREFSQEDGRLLAGLGHQVGVAIENARLFEETNSALARSNLLYELSNQLHAIQNFEETLQLAAQQILEAFQADGTLISLQEAAPGAVTRVGIFLSGRQGAERSSVPDPIAQAVMDTGRPILIPGAGQIPDHVPPSMVEEGVEALLAVPVQGLSARHGALALYYRRPKEFRPLDVETLVTYANHLGIALENARLYTVLQDRAERIAAVNRLTRVISASFDIGVVYQTFAAEVKRLIPYDRMGVVVPDGSGKGFRMFQLASEPAGTGEPASLWLAKEGTGIEWVMSQRRAHIESDLEKAKRFVEDEVLLKAGFRSTVRLPLIAKGEAIGALCLDSSTPRCYSERELELLVPLGEQLAIAIENARLFQETNRLAITDELTGLFNHRHFYHQLEQEFKRAQRYDRPLSLIILDIDFFKGYNDLRGHLAGDEALRLLADRLRSNTRSVDILARYGGDEFCIILPETDLKHAWVQAERIRSAVERDSPGAQELTAGERITVSLGVACLGSNMGQVEDLVRAADQALYRSKAAGGNQISLV